MSDYGKEVGSALEIASGNRTDDPLRRLITHFFPRTEFKAQPMAYG